MLRLFVCFLSTDRLVACFVFFLLLLDAPLVCRSELVFPPHAAVLTLFFFSITKTKHFFPPCRTCARHYCSGTSGIRLRLVPSSGDLPALACCSFVERNLKQMNDPALLSRTANSAEQPRELTSKEKQLFIAMRNCQIFRSASRSFDGKFIFQR